MADMNVVYGPGYGEYELETYYSKLISLFAPEDKGGALARLSRYRHTLDKLELPFATGRWEKADPEALIYFKVRFLGIGPYDSIRKVKPKRLKKAISDLRQSVGIEPVSSRRGKSSMRSCRRICKDLIKDIRRMDIQRGLRVFAGISEDRFIDIFTKNIHILGDEETHLDNDCRSAVLAKIKAARTKKLYPIMMEFALDACKTVYSKHGANLADDWRE